ncbi:hypothetical protein [Alicyclobacillus mengziensis]|uniref:Uncharacterized protein n=2 Tax=Alicyclobacillus TaxID=29330 RepID=A0A9X7W238_9BACL|nr:hypothetical protein [Alicyclobacillus mengziensis]QSO48777.1 hypothetical protein JZ786_07410 [Alicyclobacillus mengziensis]
MNAFITMTKDYQSALRTKRFFIRRGIPCVVRKRSDGSYALFTYAGYSYAVRNLRRQMSACMNRQSLVKTPVHGLSKTMNLEGWMKHEN